MPAGSASGLGGLTSARLPFVGSVSTCHLVSGRDCPNRARGPAISAVSREMLVGLELNLASPIFLNMLPAARIAVSREMESTRRASAAIKDAGLALRSTEIWPRSWTNLRGPRKLVA